MLERANVTYIYDGSFYGMLTCIFECFKKKQLPAEIKTDSLTFFQIMQIETDVEKAARVLNGTVKRLGAAAADYLKMAYLSVYEQKELAAVQFLNAGFTHGAKVYDMLSDAEVMPIAKAVRQLMLEKQRFLQFVRFSDYDGVLVSVIEPENNVLPLIAEHFAKRLPREKFLIYDKTRKMALVHEQDGGITISQIDNLELADAEGEEKKYRALWRAFYNTIEIKERHNERCRMNFLPKKFWKNMTEFTGD